MSEENLNEGLVEDDLEVELDKITPVVKTKADKLREKAEKAEKAKADKGKENLVTGIKVDSILIEILKNVPTFFHGGKYLSYKRGEKVKVSKAIKDILVVQNVAKVL